MRDLVPFVQFRKREKHPTLLKVTLARVFFSRFLNRTVDTKSRKVSYLYDLIDTKRRVREKNLEFRKKNCGKLRN